MELAHERQSDEEERNWILVIKTRDYIKLSLKLSTLDFFFLKNDKSIFIQKR